MMNNTEMHLLERKGKRLVLFPLPLQGHLNPMFQLANILFRKGFSINIIHTQFNSPNPSNYPHFSFHSISDGLTQSQLASMADDPIELHTNLNAKCSLPFQNCLQKLLSDGSLELIVCLITDAMWHFSQAVADKLGIPRMVLRTSSVCSFLAWDEFPFLRQKGYLPQQESQLEEKVTELPPLKVKDLPMIKTKNPNNFYEILSKMIKETKSSSGLIWNTFQDLEQSPLHTCCRNFPIPVFAIGPFHKHFSSYAASSSSSSTLLQEDQTAISWLNSQALNSVIYVSFGSVSVITEAEFLEIAWGLANCQQPFLWVVRPRSIRGSEWVEPLPKGFLEKLEGRGRIVKWAPQVEVLSHAAVAAFWTHNGWNSTMESICEGVPMICSPSFGDQFVNARYVGDVWRVGVHLEGKLERVEIERAIRRLMVEANGRDTRERIMKLKENARQCLIEGGSSFQSLENMVNHILSF